MTMLPTRILKFSGQGGSSGQWIRRQWNDIYQRKAKNEGLRARSAYKLLEINEKYPFLLPNSKVIDLGSAPGGWTQVAAMRVGIQGPALPQIDLLHPDSAQITHNAKIVTSSAPRKRISFKDLAAHSLQSSTSQILDHINPVTQSQSPPTTREKFLRQFLNAKHLVIGVDLGYMEPVEGAALLRGDFTKPHVKSVLRGKGPIDVILSDMAHSFSGNSSLDSELQMILAWNASLFAWEMLRPGPRSTFLCKVRHGCDSSALLKKSLSQRFDRVLDVKPPASRSESAEYYLLATGYNPLLIGTEADRTRINPLTLAENGTTSTEVEADRAPLLTSGKNGSLALDGGNLFTPLLSRVPLSEEEQYLLRSYGILP